MEQQKKPRRRSENPRCGAKTREGAVADTCQAHPVKGMTRCRMHGGANPAAKRKAAERQAIAKANATLATLDIKPVENPLTALKMLAGEIVAWKDQMQGYVHNLLGEPGGPTGDMTRSPRYSQEYGGEQIRGEVILFERAMDRCVAVLTAITKLNIDERLAAIDERQVAILEGALDAALNALDLDTDQRTIAWKGAERHLKRVV